MTKRKLLGLSMLLSPFVIIFIFIYITEGGLEVLRLLGALGIITVFSLTFTLFVLKALDLLEDR